MGERKVLNKYYPPDFDPAKIPRRRQPKNKQMKVRMMLPMSIRCNTCGTYIYKGTKFNSRKEDVDGENYLGIQIFRFYFKCTRCSAELTFKTDPQNSDYVMESGASRNFEPWRAADEAVDQEKTKRDSEEMGDAMKALENRTIDSKQEMDIVAALDEMKSMRARQRMVNTDMMLAVLQKKAEEEEQKIAKIDDELVKQAFAKPIDLALRIIMDEDEEGDGSDEELLKRGCSYDSIASQSKRSKALTDSDPLSGSFARPTDMLLSGSSASIAGSLHGGPPWQLTIGGTKLSPAPFLIKPKQPTKTAGSADNGDRGGGEDGNVGSSGKSGSKGERDDGKVGDKIVTRLGKPAESKLGSSGNDVVSSTTVPLALDPKGSGVSSTGLASLMASYQGGSDSEEELDD